MPTLTHDQVLQTPPRIDGHSRVFHVLGHPVGQVRAPEVFNPIFREHGVNAVLVPANVPPACLEAFVRGVFSASNMDGLWLTIPHKAAVLDLLDRMDAQGQRAAAVNAIRREADGSLTGALFDGLGLTRALDHFGASPAGQRVLLVGIGGAGAAIAAALVDRPLAELALYDRNPERAANVAASLGPHCATRVRAAATPDPAGFDLVIHATALGLNQDDPLPFDVARLRADAVVVDILMKPWATPLQTACAARGITVHPGFEMLTQQVPEYLRFFGYGDLATALQANLDPVRQRLLTLA